MQNEDACNHVSGAQGGAWAETVRTCRTLCQAAQRAHKCGSAVDTKKACTSGADCQTTTADNANAAAAENESLVENAKSGSEVAKEGREEHLSSLDKRLEQLKSTSQSNPQALATYQNDQRVVHQVKQQIKEGEIVSPDFADLAKDETIKRDLQAVSFYSSGEKSFKDLQGYHREQVKAFQSLAGSAKKNETSMESLSREDPALKRSSKASEVANIVKSSDAIRTSDLLAGKNQKSQFGLNELQMAELEKKLQKISNKILRDRLRAKILAMAKESPQKVSEILAGMDEKVAEIQRLTEKSNNPLQLEELFEEADKRSMQLETTDGFQKEIQALEDEKAGILGAESPTLFERITSHLRNCYQQSCVEGPKPQTKTL